MVVQDLADQPLLPHILNRNSRNQAHQNILDLFRLAGFDPPAEIGDELLELFGLEVRNFGETIERINTSFPHWFTATYKTFNGRAAELPVDQHMLLSLVAPRALYVASADEDLWADPRGEFLSLAASSPVFALWGDAPIRPADMPAVDAPLIVGRRGYHIRTGGHNLTPYDWDRYADFADRVWKR